MIKIISTVTMFIVRNLGINPETTVSDIEEHRLILSKKKLCFNCTGTKHRDSACLSNRSCVKCKGKHRSSICDKTTTTLLAASSCFITYLVVLIEIEGITCRALIDIGAGVFYASSILINHINKKATPTKTKKIENLMSTNTRYIL